MPALDPGIYAHTIPNPPVSAFHETQKLIDSKNPYTKLPYLQPALLSKPPELNLKPKSGNTILSDLIDYFYSFFWSSKIDKTKKRTKRSTKPSINTPCKQKVDKSPKVLAQYHTNKEIGASRNSPICNRKKFPEIVTNGYQILNEYGSDAASVSEGITGFATRDQPKTGFISINDPHYIEWQINTARASGFDGFIVEWGYPTKEASGDTALKLMKSHLSNTFTNGKKFSVEPGFILTWLVKTWNKNDSSEEKISMIKDKLLEAYDTYYQDEHCSKYGDKPLLFIFNFYGAPDSAFIPDFNELEKIFNSDPKLKHANFVYRMGNDKSNWDVAKHPQIVSDYPWFTPRLNKAKNSDDPYIQANFHKYATHNDIKKHQTRLNTFNEAFKKDLPLKTQSVNPGVDNRDASWGKCKSTIPYSENGKNTFELSWEEARSHKPNLIIAETYNDYSEGTHVEPSTEKGYTNLEINAEQSCLFKGGNQHKCEKKARQSVELAKLATDLFHTRKLQEKLKKIYPDDKLLDTIDGKMDAWSKSIHNQNLCNALKRRTRTQALLKGILYNREEFTLKNIAIREVGDRQTKFNLNNNLPGRDLQNDYAYSEGDIQLIIRRRDKDAHQPIQIQSKHGTTNALVSEFYLASDLNQTIVRLPLNRGGEKIRNRLSSNYTINHSGFDVEIKEIRTLLYNKVQVETQ